jgi:hypothetical protein
MQTFPRHRGEIAAWRSDCVLLRPLRTTGKASYTDRYGRGTGASEWDKEGPERCLLNGKDNHRIEARATGLAGRDELVRSF